MYHVNDKFYFWLLKPAAQGYKRAIPADFRGLFSNFYHNIKAPVRILNSLEAFFKKLDTPIDVAKEVYGGGRRQVSTMPLVGRTVIFLGFLVSAAFFTHLEQLEFVAVVAMVCILWAFGGSLWIFGKRAERKEEAERVLLAEAAGKL